MKDNPVIGQHGIGIAVRGIGQVSRRKAKDIIDQIEALIGSTRNSSRVDPLPDVGRDDQAAPTQPFHLGEGRED